MKIKLSHTFLCRQKLCSKLYSTASSVGTSQKHRKLSKMDSETRNIDGFHLMWSLSIIEVLQTHDLRFHYSKNADKKFQLYQVDIEF